MQDESRRPTLSPNGRPFVQPGLYAVRRGEGGEISIVPLKPEEPPVYLPSVRYGQVREQRFFTVAAAFQAAKHLAGWNCLGCDGVDSDADWQRNAEVSRFRKIADAAPG